MKIDTGRVRVYEDLKEEENLHCLVLYIPSNFFIFFIPRWNFPSIKLVVKG